MALLQLCGSDSQNVFMQRPTGIHTAIKLCKKRACMLEFMNVGVSEAGAGIDSHLCKLFWYPQQMWF